MARRKGKKYYYIPSTYKGKKFKKTGRHGGAYRGCGRIFGGSLDDLAPTVTASAQVPQAVAQVTPVDIPVHAEQVMENLADFPKITDEMIERARKVIALAEASGKAQPITKKEAGIWSGIKNLGSKAWSGVKAVASNPYVQTIGKAAIPMALGAMMPFAPAAVRTAYNFGRDALAKGERRLYNYLDRKHNAEQYEYYGDDDQGVSLVNPETGKTVAEENRTRDIDYVNDAALAAAQKAKEAAVNTGTRFKTGAKVVKNLLSNLIWGSGTGRGGAYRGCGRRGKSHLKKGSPEAKAYMSYLRSLRKSNRRKGTKQGGMFRGVTEKDLKSLIKNAREDNKRSILVNWKDKSGDKRLTKVNLKNALEMANSIKKIKHYNKYGW